jgi:hypothetical protein
MESIENQNDLLHIDTSISEKRINEHLSNSSMSHGHLLAIKEIDKEFERYDILYCIGQRIFEFYCKTIEPSAYKEYCSTMFAIQYLKEKHENEYLADLQKNIRGILNLHKIVFDFDIEKISSLYSKYHNNPIAKMALRFNCFIKCFEENCDLLCVVQVISDGNIERINHDIIFQKGISGRLLGDECVQSVFGFCDIIPDSILNYTDSIEK